MKNLISWKGNKWVLYIVATICVILWMGKEVAYSKGKDQRAARVKELIKVGEDLKDAITSQDIKRILHYISPQGMYCADTPIKFEEVENDLKDTKSELYANLFSHGGLKGYFQKTMDQKIRVDFMVVKDKEDINWACLRYMSSNYDEANWPEICLYYSNGKWAITDSLYKCV